VGGAGCCRRRAGGGVMSATWKAAGCPASANFICPPKAVESQPPLLCRHAPLTRRCPSCCAPTTATSATRASARCATWGSAPTTRWAAVQPRKAVSTGLTKNPAVLFLCAGWRTNSAPVTSTPHLASLSSSAALPHLTCHTASFKRAGRLLCHQRLGEGADCAGEALQGGRRAEAGMC